MDDNRRNTLRETAERLLQYASISDDGIISFDEDAAIAAGEDERIIQLGRDFASRDEAGWPIWGNWCGPGHGGGTVVDKIDQACKNHDLCYERAGNITFPAYNCACDKQLLRDLEAIDYMSLNIVQQEMLNKIYVFFLAYVALHNC